MSHRKGTTMSEDTSTSNTTNTDEATTGPIDLDQPVTRGRYMDTVKDLMAFLDGPVKVRNSWCTERYRYFMALIPGSSWDRDENDPVYTIGEPDEDADYVALLRTIRGKLLWYANAGTISLGTVNDAFRACGLPEYGKPKETPGFRVYASLPRLYFNVAADSEEAARDWAYSNITDFITRMLDGKTPEEGDMYVPGSGVMNGPANSVYMAMQEIPVIQVSDIIRPSYT